MYPVAKRWGLLAPAVLGLLGLSAAPAAAQFSVLRPAPPLHPAFNPAFPTVARTVPPWAAGNPYPIYGAAVLGPAGSNPYSPLAPGLTNPYVPGAGALGGMDPSFNPYYPTPYNYDPLGGFLRGQADVMRAYGTTLINQEQARVTRELANQAKIATMKMRSEYDLWLKANTPTFSEEQAKIAKQVLRRIQSNASPSDIYTGRSLNILLDDLRKYPNKKVEVEAVALPEDVVKRINVTKGRGNLGILRNEGRLAWPAALEDLLSETERKEMQLQAERLVNQARNNSRVDNNVLKDFENQLKRASALLTEQVNTIGTGQFMEAKKFLNDLDDARIALKNGDGMEYFAFQSFAAKNPDVRKIVDYMVANGLRFAPPSEAGDEAAYQALHSALAAYDVAVNAQLAATTAGGNAKEE